MRDPSTPARWGAATLIARLGADRVETLLRPSIDAVAEAGHPVVWACDPMHGNTFTSGGEDPALRGHLERGAQLLPGAPAEGTWPGGVHVELTGDDVTECLGGARPSRRATSSSATRRPATRASTPVRPSISGTGSPSCCGTCGGLSGPGHVGRRSPEVEAGDPIDRGQRLFGERLEVDLGTVQPARPPARGRPTPRSPRPARRARAARGAGPAPAGRPGAAPPGSPAVAVPRSHSGSARSPSGSTRA